MRHLHPTHRPLRAQRGLAAIEFALISVLVMLPMLLGIFVFWEVLQTQQVVTRATGDGARQALRILQAPRQKAANGNVMTNAEALNAATTLARQSIESALQSQLSHLSDVEQRLSVTLNPAGNGQLLLNVRFARPALLGSAGGFNIIEPETLTARSLIQWP